MIGPNLEFIMRPFQEMSPFHKGPNDRQHFFVIYLVIPLYAVERKATGCHFSSSIDCWERTAPVANSELSASTRKGRVSSGKINTGLEVITSFSFWKASCCSFSQRQSAEPVRSNKGRPW